MERKLSAFFPACCRLPSAVEERGTGPDDATAGRPGYIIDQVALRGNQLDFFRKIEKCLMLRIPILVILDIQYFSIFF